MADPAMPSFQPLTTPGGGVNMDALPTIASLTGQALGTPPVPAPQPAPSPVPIGATGLTDAQGNYVRMGAPGRSSVPPPAPPPFTGVDPTRSAFSNLINPPENPATTATFAAEDASRAASPGIMGAIHNFLFNPVGGPEAAAYETQKAYAEQLHKGTLAQYPDLTTAAATDPVGLAQKLGPVLEAHHNAQNGGPVTPGVGASWQTPDGLITLPDPHTERTTAVKGALGLTDEGAHALANPHLYSPQQFAGAVQAAGVTNRQLKMMWEMQHYLSPSEQAKTDVLNEYGQAAQQAPAATKSQAYQRLIDIQKLAAGLSVPLPQAP